MATPSNNEPNVNITLILYLRFSKHSIQFTYVAHAKKLRINGQTSLHPLKK